MLVYKIAFWIFTIGTVMKAYHVTLDHPRQETPTNIGVDLIAFLIQLGLAIWLGLTIWK